MSRRSSTRGRAQPRPSWCVEAGHAGVARVGDVEPAPRTAARPARCRRCRRPGARAGPGRGLLEQPGELGGRLARRQAQPLGLQLEAGAGGAQVLPAQARPDRLAGASVPHDRRCPLVGDADRLDRAAGGQGVAGHRRGRPRPWRRVELHQSRRRGTGGAPGQSAGARSVPSGSTIARCAPRSYRYRQRGC